MKKALIALITLVSIALNITAAIGDWKIYMALANPNRYKKQVTISSYRPPTRSISITRTTKAYKPSTRLLA